MLANLQARNIDTEVLDNSRVKFVVGDWPGYTTRLRPCERIARYVESIKQECTQVSHLLHEPHESISLLCPDGLCAYETNSATGDTLACAHRLPIVVYAIGGNENSLLAIALGAAERENVTSDGQFPVLECELSDLLLESRCLDAHFRIWECRQRNDTGER
jgi:hypothetical protein